MSDAHKVQCLHALCLRRRDVVPPDRYDKTLWRVPRSAVESASDPELLQCKPVRKLRQPRSCHFLNAMLFAYTVNIFDNCRQLIQLHGLFFLLRQRIDPVAGHTDDAHQIFRAHLICDRLRIACRAVKGLKQLKELVLADPDIRTSGLCDPRRIRSFQHLAAVCHILYLHTDAEAGVRTDLIRHDACRLLRRQKHMDTKTSSDRRNGIQLGHKFRLFLFHLRKLVRHDDEVRQALLRLAVAVGSLIFLDIVDAVFREELLSALHLTL